MSTPRRMRVRSIASEAGLNLITGTSRAAMFVTLLVVVFGLVAGTDIRTIVGLSTQAHEFREYGAATFVFTAPSMIDGKRCDALGLLPGVVGAGAVRQSSADITFQTAPRSAITAVEATVGLAGVLGVSSNGSVGAWLSTDAALSLGAPVGATLPTSAGPVTVTAHYGFPEDASDRVLAHALISPVPSSGRFDSCWVTMWPLSETTKGIMRGTFDGAPGEPNDTTLTQLNSTLGATFDGPARFADRETALMAWVALAIGVLIGVVSVRLRRLELAAALHAQVPRSALVLQHVIELTAVSFAVAVILMPVTYYLAVDGNPDPITAAWLAGLRIVGVGALAFLVAGTAAVASTNEKRLLTYFKER